MSLKLRLRLAFLAAVVLGAVQTAGQTSPPIITVQPTNESVIEGASAVFTILVSNLDPVSYQWQRNATNLAAATNPSYTNQIVALTDAGARYRCVIANALGTNVSAEAILSVTPDTVPPTIVSVQNVGTTNVLIVFSERVDAITAQTATNYFITNGVAVLAAVFGGDLKTIILATGPLALSADYTLVVNSVRDRAATPNTIAPDTQATFTAKELAVLDIGSATPPGSLTTVTNGSDVRGGGSDIGGAADQFQFSFEKRTGNFDVKVRLQGLTLSDVWAKAGLMARETLAANSRFASVLATPSLGGSFFEFRNVTGGPAIVAGAAPVNYPDTWLRLQRAGSIFTGYSSYDGQNWTSLGSTGITLPATIYVGMVVTSHNPNETALAQFRDFTNNIGGSVGVFAVPIEPLGPSSRRTGLAFTEIMYHPPPRADGKNLEFIELLNSQPYFEDLSGFGISGDVDYTFPPGTVLPGGGFLVIAKSPADLQSVYGISNVIGPYTNSLSNKSGTLRLRNRADAVLLEVTFDSQPPWPITADGVGHSLVLARPSYGEGFAQAWSQSDVFGGSPGGMDGYGFEPARSVVINEFLANSTWPDLDFIELYNHSNQPVDVSGRVLTDDPTTNKFALPGGTVIPARGFISLDETQLGFRLSAAGGDIYFVNASATRVLDSVRFAGQASGISTGRFADGAPGFHELTAATPGAPNSPLLIRDIVINEIMYHPISEDVNDEYVELYNRGTNTVDLSRWKFSSGISFTFATNTFIAPGGYLVVAKNLARLLTNYPNLSLGNTVGDFGGALAHKGERLALSMADPVITTNNNIVTTNFNYVVVDEVTYRDGGRWGAWSAGGGSSLELIDPHSDHRLAPNWADSDETSKAPWTDIEYTGVLDNGLPQNPADSLQVMLLDVGECLVDNVEVIPAGSTTNLVPNPNFETGLTNWFFQGVYDTSSWETNSGYLSNRSLHVRGKTDRGDTGANRIYTTLSSPVAVGSTATLRAKVRWLRGFPEFLLRLRGNWLEAYGTMSLPANLGTPGARNSRAVTNAGPAIFSVTHNPPAPAAAQAAVVTARVHDPDGVASVQLSYHVDPSTNYLTLAMLDTGTGGDAIAGDGIYSAFIPGKAAGVLVAFKITATDQSAAPVTAQFPSDAPAHECLIRFGDPQPLSSFGTYRIWITQATFNRWAAREKLSNEALDATFVYGNQRVVYNAGVLYSGSPWHSPSYDTPTGNACSYKMIVPNDDLVLGAADFNKLHWPGNLGGDETQQREKTTYWMADQLGLPYNYQRFLNLYVNGVQRNAIFEDIQVPSSDLLKEFYPTDANGDLHKVEVWFEFTNNLSSFNGVGASIENFTTTGGAKKLARYRWTFGKRALNGSASDYTNIFQLVDVANLAGAGYTAAVDSLVDIEEWVRIAALEHVVGNWDCWLDTGGQNLYIYKPQFGKWQALIWDINIDLGIGNYSDTPTSDLFKVGDPPVATLYSNPTFRRAYWRALKDAADGPLVAANVGAVMDARYAAFAANGLAISPPTVVKSWISQRRDYIVAQLASVAAPFAIRSNGGTNFSTANNLVSLTGTAPVEVKTITVNGISFPITWTSVTNWVLQFPLDHSTNLVVLQGYDRFGNALANDAASLTVIYTGSAIRPQDSLVINEIMYHPVVTNAAYVEIFNRSPAVTFNLSNYRLDGVDFAFSPGTIIRPRSFLVVAKDAAIFASTYGSAVPVAGVFAGQLDWKGETLTLIEPGGLTGADVIVDRVKYENQLPWPPLADGQGASLQLIDLSQDNSRVGNWGALSVGWRSASSTGVAYSSRFYIYLAQPGDTYVDDISLVAGSVAGAGPNLLANGDFESSLTGSWTSPANNAASTLSTFVKHSGNSSLHLVSTNPVGNITTAMYQDVQPPIALNQTYTLSYWYFASSSSNTLTAHIGGLGLNSVTPLGGSLYTPGKPNSVAASLPPFPPLWLNEVQPDNVSGMTDSFGEHDPWVEIYNASTNTVSFNGCYLTDDYGELAKWAFPSNAVIAPGQFLVVWTDGEPGQTTTNEMHTDFRLASSAGSVGLVWTANGQPMVLDYLNYTALSADFSFGAFPDGQPFARQVFRYATPGATNNPTPPPIPVAINEWMPGNGSFLADPADGRYQDWFELYNYGSNTVNLVGYFLTDTLTNKFQFQIPPGYTIAPRGYLLVWADNEPVQNSPGQIDLHVNFKLSKSGEAIGLFAADGTAVDAVTFPAQTDNVSQGRWPDGSGSLYFMTTPTPRAANVVNFPNTPPLLASIPDQIVSEGQLLVLTVTATDMDFPAQTLAYSLDAGAPLGASINPITGLFTWRPTADQAPSTNRLIVRVTDDGAPPLSASTSFSVAVLPLPRISSVRIVGGNLHLVWQSVPGKTYRVQYTEDLPTGLWNNLGSDLVGDGTLLGIIDPIGASLQRFYRITLLN